MTGEEEQGVGFKKTSAVLVFLLTTISGSIYLPIWFLRRRQAFNDLASEEKLSRNLFVYLTAGYGLVLLTSSYTAYLQAMAFLTGSEPGALVTWLSLASNALILLLLIQLIAQLLKAKRILADHINGHLGKDASFSTLWTVLLQNAYLQHKINTLLVDG